MAQIISLDDFAFFLAGYSNFGGKSIFKCELTFPGIEKYHLTAWALDSGNKDIGKVISNYQEFNFQFVEISAPLEDFVSSIEFRKIMDLIGAVGTNKINNLYCHQSEILNVCMFAHAKRGDSSVAAKEAIKLTEETSLIRKVCPLCNGARIRDMGFYKRDCECVLK